MTNAKQLNKTLQRKAKFVFNATLHWWLIQ